MSTLPKTADCVRAYYDGFRDGVRQFAYSKNGTQWVGNRDITLRDALEEIRENELYDLDRVKRQAEGRDA